MTKTPGATCRDCGWEYVVGLCSGQLKTINVKYRFSFVLLRWHRPLAVLHGLFYEVKLTPLTLQPLLSSSIAINTMSAEKMNGVGTITKDSWDREKISKFEPSDLARIEIKSENPFDLFKEWHEEATKYSTGMPNALCLATVSKDLKVTARHVVLRDYDQRGFVIVTDNRSRKTQELEEVPSAAMCILWAYPNEKNEKISRQVRIEGKIEKLLPDDFRYLYDREPFYCKIRAHLCWQGKTVDWNEQKLHHDKLVQDVLAGKQDLSMPDHFVAYRLSPDTMEYYFAYDHLIADRLLFTKESGTWTHRRIAA